MGLFGLGGLEIAVILVGVGLVLGPEKIMDMMRSSGDTANEFKEELSKVPEEFKKGMEEGEIEARSRKARPIKKVVVARGDDNEKETKK
jgi:Sec-independent protein translocase protein TatA